MDQYKYWGGVHCEGESQRYGGGYKEVIRNRMREELVIFIQTMVGNT